VSDLVHLIEASSLLIAGITPVYFNRNITEEERRNRAYNGALFVHSALKGTQRIVEWAQELIEQTFADVADVRQAHVHLDKQDFVDRAGPLKSRFTNDPKTKQLCQEFVTSIGADPERTYFDLPRLRVIPPSSFLTAGVSYNYAPHRDTWYAHPRQLINYWIPVYDTESTTVMTMFIDQFGKPVENNSGKWDYDDWVKNARYSAAQNVEKEERAHPLPVGDVFNSTNLRLVLNAADTMMFSTCQLHASTPNETDGIRFSYDLRTLNLDDLLNERGPENVDGRATGSTLRDFLRVSDLEPLEIEKHHAAS
jgi:hypothetical protein